MIFKLGKGGEVKIILIFKGDESIEEMDELYQYLKNKEIFKGNIGEVYANITCTDNKIILLGLGESDKLTLNTLRKAFFNAGKELSRLKIESVDIEIPEFANICYLDGIQAIAEGILQSEYSFEKYLSEKKVIPTIKEVNLQIVEGKEKESIESIQEIQNIIDGIFLTRNLVNEPAMTMTPKILARKAKEELEELGVEVEIYGKEDIEKLGMKAFLAVSQGSAQEPQLIVAKYNGDPSSNKKLALVGKGLTFDSGGYCLKPANGMETMFSDMAGAASVIGAMKAIAKSKLKKNVVTIIAACENLISGAAYKPGDIIESMSGKTIEVLNTDAEGRLTLADALWYAAKHLDADKIVDVATLTGACIVALGNINTGVITNNESFMNEIKKASEIAGEPIWQLPSNDEYRELIKGTFADLKNTGGRGAGTITAGLFLEEFVDNTPWIHLDIAGTSYISKEQGYLPKGATGIPVKTLYYLTKEF